MPYACFFYGTLLHPSIIRRVLDHDANHLKICPAILLNHTRHQVVDADYPGVVPYAQSRVFFDHDLSREECCVRGTLVDGLSEKDMVKLDHFEGEMYERREVQVHPLSPLVSLETSLLHTQEQFIQAGPLPADLEANAADASTYIWTAKLEWLRPTVWDYESFVKEKLYRWAGGHGWQELYEEEYKGPVSEDSAPHDGPAWRPSGDSREDFITQRMNRSAAEKSGPGNSGK